LREEIEKILIVKTSSLGDVIHCFPALDCLCRLFPKSTIDWVVEKPFAPVLKAHPHVRCVHEIETKKWRAAPFRWAHWKAAHRARWSLRRTCYDLGIDFQGNLKSGLIMGMTRSKKKIGFGKNSVTEWPNLLFTNKKIDVDISKPVSEQYLNLVAQAFPKRRAEGSFQVRLEISEMEKVWIQGQMRASFRVMVCMGSHWTNKRLALDTWKSFLKRIEKKWSPIFYFVWGNQREKEEVEKLKKYFPSSSIVLPRMSVPVWQRMISEMHLLFSVDSSALHLAATTPTPTYSFFGPSSPEIYKPPGRHHRCYRGVCPYGQVFIKRCRRLRTCTSGACLKTARSDLLFDHFLSEFSQELL